jgi:hypothetical protein
MTVAAQFLISCLLCGTTDTAVSSREKLFSGAVSLAQTLNQWALLVIGGSLVVIVSTSYYRPPALKQRLIYLLFVPAWIMLAISIMQGNIVQRSYLAYLFANPASELYPQRTQEILERINRAAGRQIVTLEWALVVLGLWLLFYLSWWILHERVRDGI